MEDVAIDRFENAPLDCRVVCSGEPEPNQVTLLDDIKRKANAALAGYRRREQRFASYFNIQSDGKKDELHAHIFIFLH